MRPPTIRSDESPLLWTAASETCNRNRYHIKPSQKPRGEGIKSGSDR
jgi:hypothetical protein